MFAIVHGFLLHSNIITGPVVVEQVSFDSEMFRWPNVSWKTPSTWRHATTQERKGKPFFVEEHELWILAERPLWTLAKKRKLLLMN